MTSRWHTHFGTFKNPHTSKPPRGFFHFLLWQLGYYKDPAPLLAPQTSFHYPNEEGVINEKSSSLVWVNHSTFLIRCGSYHILTDPIWNTRCSPVRFWGPRRKIPPAFPLSSLPILDLVIISHNHYDHMDLSTLQKLSIQFPQLVWIVPLGIKKWFLRHLPHVEKSKIIELDWWESYLFDGSLKLTAVPAQHFSGRGFFDRNRSLWMGCIGEIQDKGEKKRFYFAGDTGYNSLDFKEIGKRMGPVDLSLIPIGTYSPRDFMQPVHICPEESAQIHLDVQSRLSVGGHWGTFRLSEEPLDRPPYDLYHALKKKGIPCEKFRVLKPGQKINW